MRETARNFFEKELAPHASDIDRDNDFPKFRVREMVTLATLLTEGGGIKGSGESGSLVPEGGGIKGSRESGLLVPEDGGIKGNGESGSGWRDQGARRVGHLYQRVGGSRGAGRVGHLYRRVGGSGGEESGSLVPEGGGIRGRGEWVTLIVTTPTASHNVNQLLMTITFNPPPPPHKAIWLFILPGLNYFSLLIQQDIINQLSPTQLVCFVLTVHKLLVLVVLSLGAITLLCLFC